MRQDQCAKVAIVLVPGYYDTPQPGWPRDRLAAILARVSGSPPPRRVTVAGEDGLRLAMPGPPPFHIDLFEFSWRAPEQSVSIPFDLPVRAFSVTGYWMGGFKFKKFKEAGKLARISFGSGVIALSVILWWAALLLLLIQKLDLVEGGWLRLPGDTRVWTAGIGLFGAVFWTWASALLRRLDYLRNYLSSPPQGPYRSVARAQLLDLILRLSTATHESPAAYERLLLVAHSFGAVIAVDLLGSVPKPELPDLRLMTMGSPFAGLRPWEDWIDCALDRAFERQRAGGWTDLYSETDWLCGPVPGHAEQFGAEASVKLKFVAPWLERASQQTHDRYLDDEETARRIVKAAEALAVKTRA